MSTTFKRQNNEIMDVNTESLIEREKKILAFALQEIKPHVDRDDLQKVADDLEITIRTVERYMTGQLDEIREHKTAKAIIAALRKKIIERENELQQLQAAS